MPPALLFVWRFVLFVVMPIFLCLMVSINQYRRRIFRYVHIYISMGSNAPGISTKPITMSLTHWIRYGFLAMGLLISLTTVIAQSTNNPGLGISGEVNPVPLLRRAQEMTSNLRMLYRVVLLFILPAIFGCLSIPLYSQPRKLSVAAASDLKYALDSVIGAYQASHKEVAIVATYGSSGKFFEQISNGAPFDVFFSADIGYPEKLTAAGKTGQPLRRYGRGRIVIWSRRLDPNERGMKTLLDARITKIAIANPEHAPYGRRAVEAMQREGIYEQVTSRLVYGENISQAAQFVTTGAADAGIVALSLALSPAMRDGGKYFLIPENYHQPLEQAVVILKKAASNADARTFQEFVLGARGKAILSYFGFQESN